jgi:dihydrolipoamide dehydrogenase
MGARLDDLNLTIHPHPTLYETVMEAAQVFFGVSPHYIAKRR